MINHQNADADKPRQSLKALQIGMFGAAMGIEGLGLVWRATAEIFGAPAIIGNALIVAGIVVFVVLLAAYGLKAVRYPELVAAEYRNSAQAGFFSTVPISMVLIAFGIRHVAFGVAEALWWVSAALIFTFSLLLIVRFLTQPQSIEHANGSWMVTLGSPLIIPSLGGDYGYPVISHFMMGVGLFGWGVFFPIAFNRAMFGAVVPYVLRPTWFIYIVPPSLIFLAYLQLNGGEVDFFARTIYYMVLFLLAILCVAVRDVHRWPFAGSWWAFTFPLVVVTYSALVFYRHFPTTANEVIGLACIALTTAVVLYVAVRSAMGLAAGTFFAPPPQAVKEAVTDTPD